MKETNNYAHIEKQKIPNSPVNEEYNKIVYNKQKNIFKNYFLIFKIERN